MNRFECVWKLAQGFRIVTTVDAEDYHDCKVKASSKFVNTFGDRFPISISAHPETRITKRKVGITYRVEATIHKLVGVGKFHPTIGIWKTEVKVHRKTWKTRAGAEHTADQWSGAYGCADPNGPTSYVRAEVVEVADDPIEQNRWKMRSRWSC